MKILWVSSIFLIGSASAHAECSLNLSYGQGNVSNIPTEHVQDALTSRYTHVESHVDGRSNIHEIGAECEVWRDFHIAVSHLDGLQASVNHELYFNGFALGTINLPGVDLSGYSFPGVSHPRITVPSITLPNIPPSNLNLSHLSVPGFKVLDFNEKGSAEAWRVSIVKYFEMGRVDPFLRIGAHHVKGVHQLNVPIVNGIRLSYKERHELETPVVPYVGAGLTYNRGRSISFRAGAELLSLGPHNIWTWSAGIDVPIRFK